MRAAAVLLALALALPAAAQPGPSPQMVEAYAACAERWAVAHAGAIATAYEVADAAVDACPEATPASLLLGAMTADNPLIAKLRAYARARALVAVVKARDTAPLK